MSEKEGITRFDLFRFTPSKFLEQTVTGALISLAVLLLSGYLVYHEVDEALGNGIKTEVLFENLHMSDLLVTLDFDMVHIPCEVVDLRFTSKRGARHTLKRYHLKNAEDPSKHVEYIFSGPRLLKDVSKAWKNGEGCKIKGQFHLHFLSNNFYVGVGNNILLAKLLQMTKKTQISLEHRIHQLSFGPNSSNAALSKKFDLRGFNTLGGHYSNEKR